MFKFHDVQQNSDEWQALRCGKVTNSNAGTFMANLGKSFGDPAKRYALQIALEQLTGVKAAAGFTNEHTERGHEQEPIARMLYQEETFSVVTNGGFFCWGSHGDSPDGLVGDVGGIEIKCVIAPVHYDTIRRGSFDPAYRWQLIGHLDCTGREWFDFVSYCGDFPAASRLFVHRLYRRDYEQEIAQLRARRDELLALIADIKADVSRVAA